MKCKKVPFLEIRNIKKNFKQVNLVSIKPIAKNKLIKTLTLITLNL